MLVIFIISILMILPSVCVWMASNYRTHTDEWRDERFIEWLKRPLPEVKIDLGQLKQYHTYDKVWKEGSWILEILPGLTNDTCYYIGKDLAVNIHEYDCTPEDLIAFLDKPSVSSRI